MPAVVLTMAMSEEGHRALGDLEAPRTRAAPRQVPDRPPAAGWADHLARLLLVVSLLPLVASVLLMLVGVCVANAVLCVVGLAIAACCAIFATTCCPFQGPR